MDGGINRHQPLHYGTNNYLEPWHKGKLHTTQSTAIYIRILFLLDCLFASASLAGFSSTISAPVRQKITRPCFESQFVKFMGFTNIIPGWIESPFSSWNFAWNHHIPPHDSLPLSGKNPSLDQVQLSCNYRIISLFGQEHLCQSTKSLTSEWLTFGIQKWISGTLFWVEKTHLNRPWNLPFY